jgi:hypothetical protein
MLRFTALLEIVSMLPFPARPLPGYKSEDPQQRSSLSIVMFFSGYFKTV